MQIFPKIKNLTLLFFFISLFFSEACVKIEKSDTLAKATYDISKNFDTSIVYNMNGDWDFVWDTLLTPFTIQNYQDTIYKVKVPDYWTNYKIDGKHLPNFGYATYHAKFIVPHPGIYAFKFKRIFLSAKIFVNDSVILSIGQVANNHVDYTPSRQTYEIPCYLEKDTNDIIIQVANFSHKKAGITRSIKFGSIKAIKLFTYTTLLYDTFVVGSLLFMMIFFLFLYNYNRNIKSNLFFSLFLFVNIIPIIFDRELIFYRIFHNLSWSIASKIYYIATYVRPFIFILLIDSLSEGIINKHIKRGSLYFSILMSLFVIATPMKIYSRTLFLMVIFTFSTFIYELVVLLKNKKNNKSLHYILWPLLFMILTSINDALYEFRVINTFYASGIGIFTFTLLQAIEISIRNAKLMNTEDLLTNKFQIQNRLKISLLNTPSYDLKKVMQGLNKNLNIDKILLFTVDQNNLILSINSSTEKVVDNINKKIDFKTTYNDFDINLLKLAYKKNKPIVNSDLNASKRKNRTLVLPLISQNNVIAIVYFENEEKMTNGLIEVLSSSQNIFNSIINTAVTYFNLEALNYQLDQTVKERTEKVNDQKIELQKKNEELDEKIQLLQEQYEIQTELNKSMEANIEEIKQDNELLDKQNNFIKEQNKKIEQHYKLIKTDINFANNIINILQNNESINYFAEYFHIDLPKNIISGDFLFVERNDDIIYLGLGDATGHGVPGALMRTYAHKQLFKIISNLDKENTFNAGKILDILRNTIKKSFSSDNIELSEGIDLCFTIFDFKENKIYYSGAYSSLFLVRNGEMKEFKADRMPVGKYIQHHETPFHTQVIPFLKNDIFYMNSDGFPDQFGGENFEKYYISNLKKYYLSIHRKPLNIQKSLLIREFEKFKGENTQIDDVSILGIKI